MDELVCRTCGPTTAAPFLQVIQGLVERGCVAVILACTEITSP